MEIGGAELDRVPEQPVDLVGRRAIDRCVGWLYRRWTCRAALPEPPVSEPASTSVKDAAADEYNMSMRLIEECWQRRDGQRPGSATQLSVKATFDGSSRDAETDSAEAVSGMALENVRRAVAWEQACGRR